MRSVFPAVLATLALASCSGPSVSVAPFIANVGLQGDLAITDDGGSNADSSFDDLGLGDNEAVFGGLVRFGFGGGELSISGYSVGFEGEGTVDGDLVYEGTVISANTDVATELDLDTARALFTWDIIPIRGVELGIGIGATLLDLEINIQELGSSNRIDTDQLFPVPLIAVRAAWTWGPVELRADAGGLVFEYDDAEAAVFDVGLSGAVDFLGIGDLVVGYKFMDIDAEYEDDATFIDADLELSGWYGGLRFGF
ncbi:MAG: hypothetical protein AAGA20_08210 [Planctomycetota bacterium]